MKNIVISQEELDAIRNGALNEIDRLTAKLKDTLESYFLRFRTDEVHTWSMYRGNPAHTGTVGPTHRMVGGRLKFTREIGPGVKTPPIVTPQHIFTPAAGGSELECLALETGEQVWSFSLGAKATSPAVVSWDGFVYVPTDDQELYSIGVESGLLRWRFHLDDLVLCSPCVDGTSVFLSTREGYLLALDAQSSKLKWMSPWESAFSEPTAAKANIFIGTYDGCLMSVWQGSGDIRWKTACLGKATSSATYHDGRVYYSLPESDERRGSIHCLNAETAEIIWRHETPADMSCTSAVSGESLYLVAQNRLESLTAADARKRWSFSTETPIRSCPTVIEPAVFVTTRAGVVHAVDSKNGKELWKYDLGTGIVGSAAYAGGLLVVAGEDGKLYAFE